jgi:hypothetical protein
MSIETYQTERARAILDKVGWPEWDVPGEGEKSGLRFSDNGWYDLWSTYNGEWYKGCGCRIQDHLALCLLRNHLREFLVKNHVLPPRPAWLGDDKDVWLWSSDNVEGDTEDEALLAAAEAVLADDES